MKLHLTRWLLVSLACATWSVAFGQGPSLPFDAPIVVGDDQTRLRASLDYDADGFTDFVSVWFPSDTVITVKGYRGDGAGHLLPDWSVTHGGVTPLAVNNQPAAPVATGDFDGDGRDDFVLALNHFVGYWLSNGAGAIPTVQWIWPEPSVIDQVLAADFDGDGRPDIVLQQGTQLRIYLTQTAGSPVLSSFVTFATTSYVSRCFITDVNGDATPDLGMLANTSPNAQLKLYPVFGGVMGAPLSFLVPSGSEADPVSGDVDGDSDVDIVVFTSGASVWQVNVLRRTGPAMFALEAPYPGGPATHLVDYDQDGDLDGVGASIVVPTTSCVISLNGGTGDFGPYVDFPVVGLVTASGGATTSLAGATDLNQDGYPDLVAGRSVYFGRGSGSKPPSASGTFVRSPREVGDLDGDGDPDSYPGSQYSTAFGTTTLNQGDGVFSTVPVTGTQTNLWMGPGFPGDFDGDGDLDILVNKYTGTTHLLRNLGCGVMVDAGPAAAGSMGAIPGVLGSIPQQPLASFVADLDGDGDLDFIAEFPQQVFVSSGHSKIWLNQGGGFFVPGQDLVSFLVVGAAEMTQDGAIDLLAQLQPAAASVAQLVMLSGAGDGTFPTGVLLDPNTHRVNVPAIGDFDGDGDLDVFSIGNQSAVLIANLGAGAFAPPVSYPALAPAAWTPISPVLALPPRRAFATDVDGDGLADVVAGPLAGSGGTGIMLRDGPGGTFGTTVVQVFMPAAFSDVDGDGDGDALGGDRVAMNLRFVPPGGGARKQYGTGAPGTGGIVPILGEVGPFREGSTVELRLTGGLGGASGILVVGAAPANVPLFGGTLLVTPSFSLTIQLGGPAGAPGEGTFSLPFLVPPGFGGTTIWHQAGLSDPAGAFGISSTNGLQIDFGQ